MTKKGLRKTAEERNQKKTAKPADKLFIGAAAVTTASAMVAAIYAACRALDREKKVAAEESDKPTAV